MPVCPSDFGYSKCTIILHKYLSSEEKIYKEFHGNTQIDILNIIVDKPHKNLLETYSDDESN